MPTTTSVADRAMLLNDEERALILAVRKAAAAKAETKTSLFVHQRNVEKTQAVAIAAAYRACGGAS